MWLLDKCTEWTEDALRSHLGDPFCVSQPGWCTVIPRSSDTRTMPLITASTSRRLVLQRLAGGLAAFVVAFSAPGRSASAQEMIDPGPGRWQTGWNEVVISLGAQRL